MTAQFKRSITTLSIRKDIATITTGKYFTLINWQVTTERPPKRKMEDLTTGQK
jgi:hypothetical protein